MDRSMVIRSYPKKLGYGPWIHPGFRTWQVLPAWHRDPPTANGKSLGESRQMVTNLEKCQETYTTKRQKFGWLRPFYVIVCKIHIYIYTPQLLYKYAVSHYCGRTTQEDLRKKTAGFPLASIESLFVFVLTIWGNPPIPIDEIIIFPISKIVHQGVRPLKSRT